MQNDGIVATTHLTSRVHDGSGGQRAEQNQFETEEMREFNLQSMLINSETRSSETTKGTENIRIMRRINWKHNGVMYCNVEYEKRPGRNMNGNIMQQ